MKEENIPDILLERYLINEVSRAEKEAIENAVKKDPLLQEKLEKIKMSNFEIHTRYKSSGIAASIQQKINSSSTSSAGKNKEQNIYENVLTAPPKVNRWLEALFQKRWAYTLATTFFVATVAISLFTNTKTPHEDFTQGEVIYTKGDDAKILLYRQRDNAIEQLADRSIAMENDKIQISYFVDQPSFTLIFSIDGNGVVTPHTGNVSKNPIKVDGGKTYILDHSYQLDNAPRFETFFLVYSASPFNTETVIQKIIDTASISDQGIPQKDISRVESNLKIAYITLIKKNR